MNLIDTFFPERFSRKDKFGVVLLVLSSAISFTALWIVRPPSRENNNSPIAKILFTTNKVKYKASGSVSFYEVFKGKLLHSDDEVFTGENSVASIQFIKSKNKLKVPSSSLVKIEDSANGETVEVKQGVVDILVTKDESVQLMVNGKKNTITSDKSASVVKAYYSAGELHLLTKDRGVRVTNEQNEEKAIGVNKDSALVDRLGKNKNLFNVIQPLPGEKIEPNHGIKIKLDQSLNYKIKLSKNLEFTNPVAELSFEGKEYVLDFSLEEGTYYLKIEYLKTIKIIPVNIVSKFKISNFEPANDSIVTISTKDSVLLKWSPVEVKSYKVTIHDSTGEEKSIVVHEPFYEILSPKGEWIEWSIAPEISEKKYSNVKKKLKFNLKYSGKIELINEGSLIINKSLELKHDIKVLANNEDNFLARFKNKITKKEFIKKILKNKTINLAELENGSYSLVVSSVNYPSLVSSVVEFSVVSKIATWNKEMLKTYQSKDDNMSLVLKINSSIDSWEKLKLELSFKSPEGKAINEIISLNKLKTLKLIGFGNYCLTIIPPKEMEFSTKSEVYCFNFVAAPTFDHSKTGHDTVMERIVHGGVDSYKIEVKKMPDAKKYHLEIFKDKENTELVYKVDSSEPIFYWVSAKSGIYYMRYSVLDSKNRMSEFSPSSRLIFPISPLSEW
jgi:hypothetical protein